MSGSWIVIRLLPPDGKVQDIEKAIRGVEDDIIREETKIKAGELVPTVKVP